MKIKILILVSTLLFIIFSSPHLSLGRDKQEGIPLSQVPRNVISAAKESVSGIRLLDAKKIIKDDGNIVYMLDVALGQKGYEVMVDSEGQVIGGDFGKERKNELPISRVPGNILLAARNSMSGFKVLKVYTIEDMDGEMIYELEGAVGRNTYRIRISKDAEIVESGIIDKYIEHDEDLITLKRMKKQENENKK